MVAVFGMALGLWCTDFGAPGERVSTLGGGNKIGYTICSVRMILWVGSYNCVQSFLPSFISGILLVFQMPVWPY